MQKQIGQVFNLVFKCLVLKSTRRTCQDPFGLNKNIKTDRVCIFRLADGKTKCRPILRYPLKRQKRKKNAQRPSINISSQVYVAAVDYTSR